MAWLGEELPADQQAARTPFSPRCTKDVIEERLFAHRRDLFTRLDLVFFALSDLVKNFLRFFPLQFTNWSTSLVASYKAA
jgi:hypothetical protein